MSLAKLNAPGGPTPLEALETSLAAIEERNGDLNALVALDPAGARQAAEAATERRQRGARLSPLDGAPVVIKANVAVEGLPWTAALGPYGARTATRDAEVVRRLRAAGAAVLGVANMHEGALGATTTSPLHGQGVHPQRAGFTPGGSSGGSAAAVAAGFAMLAIGTDTMGSVRLPSSYCGIAGMKPSFGRAPRDGVELLSFTLDHVGVHAHEVADLRPFLTAIADEGRAENGAVLPPLLDGVISVNGLRVGRLGHDVAVQGEVADRFEAALATLVKAGARCVEAVLPISLATLRRRALLVTEAECATLFAQAGISREDPRLSESFRQMIGFGASQPAERLAEAHHAIHTARLATAALFQACDVIVCPTTPHVAFPFAQPAPAEQADLTVLANVCGLPAVSIPMGEGSDGMPCGLQIMAPYGADGLALSVAEAVSDLLQTR